MGARQEFAEVKQEQEDSPTRVFPKPPPRRPPPPPPPPPRQEKEEPNPEADLGVACWGEDEEWGECGHTKPAVLTERLWRIDEMTQLEAVLANSGYNLKEFFPLHPGPTTQKRTIHGQLWEHVATKPEPVTREQHEVAVEKALEETHVHIEEIIDSDEERMQAEASDAVKREAERRTALFRRNRASARQAALPAVEIVRESPQLSAEFGGVGVGGRWKP